MTEKLAAESEERRVLQKKLERERRKAASRSAAPAPQTAAPQAAYASGNEEEGRKNVENELEWIDAQTEEGVWNS
jgi:hypothetical protein